VPEPASDDIPHSALPGASAARLRASTPRGVETVGPRAGDVVVSKAEASAACTLSVFPGPPQLLCPSRVEAVAMARSFVRRRRVDSWLIGSGAAFELLEHNR
jgi:hypothetical protein